MKKLITRIERINTNSINYRKLEYIIHIYYRDRDPLSSPQARPKKNYLNSLKTKTYNPGTAFARDPLSRASWSLINE